MVVVDVNEIVLVDAVLMVVSKLLPITGFAGKTQKQIDGTGFRSVTEYVVFLLRESLMLKAGESVKERLRALGYID